MPDVARVAVGSPLPHLDRLFDFAIPEELDAQAQPGCRVKIRFHGRRIDGWLVERGPTEYEGVLQPLLRVVGPPVLTPEVRALCRLVADRYAGSLTDVLRFAVPARVAAVEGRQAGEPPPRPQAPDLSAWRDYGLPESGAASWICHPHDDPFAMLAALAVDTASRGRGAILVVPDARDVRRVHAELTTRVDPSLVAVVSAEASARMRYRTHLELQAGLRPIVVGTRSAVFAPVPDPGLIAVWDDGDDVLAEQQTPGWHAREVAALRGWRCAARVVVGGYVRTAATAQWLADGHAHDVRLNREDARGRRYRVEALVEPQADARRIPGRAFSVMRSGLGRGCVLVQVPRAGAAAGLVCAGCGHVLRCPACGGGVRPDRRNLPRCRLCHRAVDTCGRCGGREFVGVGAGSRRSAEQLQRAFPGVPVIRSDADHGVLDDVPPGPSVVVATPGSEPAVPGGYAALVVLDTEVLLARTSLRAREEAARRWMAAIAKTEPGATTLLVAPQDVPVVQALVRNDPAGLAQSELRERAGAHMPPAWRCVRLCGETPAVHDWLDGFTGDVLGPLDTTTGSQAVLRAPLAAAGELLRAVKQRQVQRSRAGKPAVEVRVDPADLGEV